MNKLKEEVVEANKEVVENPPMFFDKILNFFGIATPHRGYTVHISGGWCGNALSPDWKPEEKSSDQSSVGEQGNK